ncbi:MAG: hypothetical protein JWR70_2119, partial [Modestobacter sp.]|nr:hypothetical protein [Modestobacter sp.]
MSALSPAPPDPAADAPSPDNEARTECWPVTWLFPARR